MLKSIAYSLLIVSSYALYGMKQDNNTNIDEMKIKSLASSIASSLKATAPKIAEYPNVQLADILQINLDRIKLLKTGQIIEITDQATKILEERKIVYTDNQQRKFIRQNKAKVTIKEAGMYSLRKDSQLDWEQAYALANLGVAGAQCILSSYICHHIELCKILELIKPSIFNSHCLATTIGYDLDIFYDPEYPEKLSDSFELKEYKAPLTIDNPAFTDHEKRINKLTATNSESTYIKNLLLLKRK